MRSRSAAASALRTCAGPLGMLEGTEPNLARYVFLHPDARTVYLDWTAVADDQLGRLHAATARCRDDARFATLIDELHESPDFAERWSKFAATDKRRGTTRILHPDFGRLRINYEVLLLPDEIDELRLITWHPANEPTADAFRTLGDTAAPSSPAQLRVIG